MQYVWHSMESSFRFLWVMRPNWKVASTRSSKLKLIISWKTSLIWLTWLEKNFNMGNEGWSKLSFFKRLKKSQIYPTRIKIKLEHFICSLISLAPTSPFWVRILSLAPGLVPFSYLTSSPLLISLLPIFSGFFFFLQIYII